jgi:hypothetical protein
LVTYSGDYNNGCREGEGQISKRIDSGNPLESSNDRKEAYLEFHCRGAFENNFIHGDD